jgi:hypothetical protein
MTLSTYIAAAVVAVIVGWCLKALIRAIKRDIDRVDDWWQPSEAGKLAKERYDEKQAAKEQKQILRNANKPTYQQPNRSNS